MQSDRDIVELLLGPIIIRTAKERLEGYLLHWDPRFKLAFMMNAKHELILVNMMDNSMQMEPNLYEEKRISRLERDKYMLC